jgi:hypothetical protein
LEIGITGHNFGRGPSKDLSTKVWLQLARDFLWTLNFCLFWSIIQIRKKGGWN